MTPTPREVKFGLKSVKLMYSARAWACSEMQYFLSSSCRHWIRQLSIIIIMTKGRSTKIVNFMSRRGRVGLLILRCGHTSHCSEYALCSTLSIYSTLIAYGDVFLCSCSTTVVMCKYEPFWRYVSVEFLISGDR